MAWRQIGKKSVYTTLRRSLNQTHIDYAVARISTSTSEVALNSIFPPSISYIPGLTGSLNVSSSCQTFPNVSAIRHFHASSAMLASNNVAISDPNNRTTKKGKFSRKKKMHFQKEHKIETKTPTDAPYVPRKLKGTGLQDKTVDIFEGMTVVELAKRTGESVTSLQDILINVGEVLVSEFDPLTIDVAELVAMEVGVNVRRQHSNEGAEVLPRPPVVTVMGHVDHGKTSLLDALRDTSVAAREAGGITQHLGAFVVTMPSGASITFLDTPGHAAFSAMRARGAAVTDIVVLVVAADDGVMPQTLEAISHAKAANVPIVVAINKCDKESANAERVKIQLATEGLLLEDVGGDIQVVEVSAIKKIGLESLEESLLLQADMMELKARVDGPAQAYVVEARLHKGRGPLATAIVKAGTLVVGQHVVVGSQWGRIRAIRDATGKSTERATPAMPVEIEGLKGLPMAGDDIIAVGSEERARMLSEGRRRKFEKDRLIKISEGRAKSLETDGLIEVGETESSEESEEVIETVEMPIIVKADVQGTVQAVSDALRSLSSSQVFVNVVHVGVGPISQSDVDFAIACKASIVGFNVKPSAKKTATEATIKVPSVEQTATKANIKIFHHRVIYHLLEDIGKFIVETAPGTNETRVAGEAEVLSIFELKGRSKAKGDDVKIAGCRVNDGRVTKSATLKLLRSGEVVFEGSCASLKREKQDVEAVGKGNECGLILCDFDDFRVGDVIHCMEQVVRKPKFVSCESGAVRIEC